MKELLILIAAGTIAFFAGRGIGQTISSAMLKEEKAELELLKMKAAYLEGVKVGRSGDDWKDRWEELELEFAKK